jgi:DNA-binding transcriptional LysR family regulator
MTIEQVEAFLAVLNYGNISNAADRLYVTQTAVSNRIQALENELGVKLILRQRGQHSVECTAFGQSFVPLANQWIALWKDTQKLKLMSDIQILNIAATESINNGPFVSLYNDHINRHPNIKLCIHTYHSEEINSFIEDRRIDIGFVFHRFHYPNIIAKPVFHETRHLICRVDSPYHNNIDPSALDPENEIYFKWNTALERWYDRHWKSRKYSAVTLNNGALLPYFLKKPEHWAIAPFSLARKLSLEMDFTYYSFSDPPPSRTCYKVVHRYPKASHVEAIKTFESELGTFIDSNPQAFPGPLLD